MFAAACSTDGRDLREPGTGGATPRPIPETTTSIDMFADAEPGTFVLRSPVARPGDLLPHRNARGGSNIAPELGWQGVPAGTVELAVVMVDVNADNFVHWVVTGIDPASPTLFEALVPPGAVQALNDFGELGWGGPAPPIGEDAHGYMFKLLALGEPSGMESGAVGSAVVPVLEAKAIGVAELITFYRQTAAVDP